MTTVREQIAAVEAALADKTPRTAFNAHHLDLRALHELRHNVPALISAVKTLSEALKLILSTNGLNSDNAAQARAALASLEKEQ